MFVQKCLDKDPSRRSTCEQLLRHPYFNGSHDEDSGPPGRRDSISRNSSKQYSSSGSQHLPQQQHSGQTATVFPNLGGGGGAGGPASGGSLMPEAKASQLYSRNRMQSDHLPHI